MKHAILLLACFLAGCGNEPEQVDVAGNGYSVERLFTQDGCTVYRFRDGGRYRYFTNCRGSTSWR